MMRSIKGFILGNITGVLDWVYPTKCSLCGRLDEDAICGNCFESFERIAAPFEAGSKLSPLDYQISLFQYTGRAAQAVQRLKYERVTSLAFQLSRCLLEASQKLLPEPCDLIVPVPIHWRRWCWRGFNQSELLAEAFPHRLVRYDVLMRTRATVPQVKLTPKERLTNVDGAFEVRQKVEGLHVLLIDDVITTGGTAQACCATLKAAGAAKAGILTVCGVGAVDPQQS